MDKFAAIIIGAICGIGQFLMLRYTLKPLSEGKTPKVSKVKLSQLPIPLVMLFGCAFIDIYLLLFVGIAFCLSLFAASVVNHFITMKKKD